MNYLGGWGSVSPRGFRSSTLVWTVHVCFFSQVTNLGLRMVDQCFEDKMSFSGHWRSELLGPQSPLVPVTISLWFGCLVSCVVMLRSCCSTISELVFWNIWTLPLLTSAPSFLGFFQCSVGRSYLYSPCKLVLGMVVSGIAAFTSSPFSINASNDPTKQLPRLLKFYL